jgi:hypothetical protein
MHEVDTSQQANKPHQQHQHEDVTIQQSTSKQTDTTGESIILSYQLRFMSQRNALR